MPPPGFQEREWVRQNIFTFPLLVPLSPASVPISGDPLLVSNYIDSFFVSVPAGGNNVFLGPAGVVIATGLEIIAGGGIASFVIDNGGRQVYEVQKPIMDIAAVLKCEVNDPIVIPFASWDLSQLFLTATGAAQNVVIGFSPARFV